MREPKPVEVEREEEAEKATASERVEKKTIKRIREKHSNTSLMKEYMHSNYYFIKIVLKWKYHFLVVSALAMLAAAVFSSEWFIKPKYKSIAIVYPSNIIPYGSESPSEQMLQLFSSADIRDAVIKKLDLAKHYGIDPTAAGGLSYLISTYESNVEISRTQFESIEIKVLDTDPKIACEMVNEIIAGLNLKARNLQRDKTHEVLVMTGNQLAYKKHQIDSLDNGLHELRVKYQVLDYYAQVKEVTKAYLKAVQTGKNAKEADTMLRNLEEKGGEYDEMKRTYDVFLESYNKARLEYDNILKDLNKELTYTNLVTKPFPADRKSYPIRWLIVTASFASANLFLFLVLVMMDFRKKLQE